MPFLIYLAVVVVSVFSILLEADVLVEPTYRGEHASVAVAAPAEPAPLPRQQNANADRAPASKPRDAAVTPVAPAPAKAVAAPTQPALPAEARVVERCDVAACTAAYRSFRAADCTYQPVDGPRRLCSKGEPAAVDAEAAAPDARSDGNAGQSTACNADACAAAYGSFNPADCTYQPYDGPRRLCTK